MILKNKKSIDYYRYDYQKKINIIFINANLSITNYMTKYLLLFKQDIIKLLIKLLI